VTGLAIKMELHIKTLTQAKSRLSIWL